MSEQQLERSVLEAKEREELFAIADALGTKPASRAKKSDLVTLILRATGVEAGAEEPAEAPKRTRTRRTAAAAPPKSEGGGDREAAQLPLDDEAPLPEAEAPSASNGNDASDANDANDANDAKGRDGNGRDANGRDGMGRDGNARGASAKPAAATPAAAPAAAKPAASQPGPAEPAPSATNAGPPNAASGPNGASGASGAETAPSSGRFDIEPGNRRNRRRRGRDRSFDRGGDLPGQAPEAQYAGEPTGVNGYLDLRPEGYGFLRTGGMLPGVDDVYVSISQVRRFALRKGDMLEGASRPAGGNEKYPALLRIDKVSGMEPEEARARPRFEELTPLFPDHKMRLEIPGDAANVTARIVDLISPIGKGQRGLIVSPPKAGKTTILKQIAHSIEANNPDVHLMVLLVDERPEEVTDMRRSVNGEVIASTFDRPAEEHTQVSELAIERAKRMVEAGRDVVIVLDGITRLARAYNLAQPATGRIMSGGIDTGALYPPKKFFGAARNIEEGGSLTILATALVETGSKMDEVIFEEFKGTGNMELRLDRRLAERRIYPAIDVNASSTRHEELLFDRVQLQQVWKLRRVLNALGSEGSQAAGLELLVDRIKTTKSNDEFLAEVAKNPVP
jgi:transcription termination factor Rho